MTNQLTLNNFFSNNKSSKAFIKKENTQLVNNDVISTDLIKLTTETENIDDSAEIKNNPDIPLKKSKKRSIVYSSESDTDVSDKSKSIASNILKRSKYTVDSKPKPIKNNSNKNLTTNSNEISNIKSQKCADPKIINLSEDWLEIAEIMKHFFLKMIKLGPDHLTKCIYLCLNQVAPEYEGIEIGVGESLLMKAIASATGKNLSKVKSEAEKCGDLGTVAQEFRTNQKTLFPMPKLTIDGVFNTFYEISISSGLSSQQKKINKISTLVVSGSQIEAKYIVRSLEGKLRIGLAEKTVLTALAQAFTIYHCELEQSKVTPELLSTGSEIVKNVYTQLPNFKILVDALLKHKIEKLPEICKLMPGIPVKPMLAHPTKSISEVLDRFNGVKFTCEYKYDGERIQIHKDLSGKITSFSRNSEKTTEKYSDILLKCAECIASDVTNFIIDAEVVAWDTAKNCILPFQILSTRKRKDVKENEITVQVCLFVFDILYLNNQSLLQTPFEKRRQVLKDTFVYTPGTLEYAKHENLNEIDDIQTFLDKSIINNCEGLMVKVLDGEESFYEPSKRSRNWLKIKKDYLQGIGDSLDLVVIGAYIGKGKRVGVYGGFLLASYDQEKEEYQSICKIGTGFSEADLKNFKEEFEKLVISDPRPYYIYGEATKPDVWFEPAKVWEVKAADLSISPVYKSAIGYISENKGISLRFPRFIRVRDDKAPEDATNSDQIFEMYEAQGNNTQS
ncbi:hypothetical protein BB561_004059 [Smittium simulii]|uniref:DNA ligase n=1 Tax=Smittium simulii TaxID=133385 RepID=A0A2T9YID9_9FUNG|nr:hypothetical protein BB561_004059 [Smittium simulii]